MRAMLPFALPPAPSEAGRLAAALPRALAPYRDRPLHIVGVASLEGAEMARFCLACGCSQLVGHDLAPADEVATAFARAHAGLAPRTRAQRWEALATGLRDLRLGDRYLAGLDEAAVVVPTQAWFLNPRNRPLEALRAAGRPFYSLAQAYLDCARGPVVGVSGSHGKSTTAALVARLLSAGPRSGVVRSAGNDRHQTPCLVEVASGAATDVLVLEISNRQLLQMASAPEVACLTNLTPNHLDEHNGLDGYVDAKRRLFSLPGNRVAVRNADDPISRARCPAARGAEEWRFAASETGLEGFDGAFEIDEEVVVRRHGVWAERVGPGPSGLLGAHNRQNVRAAVATVAAMGRLADTAADALADFQPLRHRIQLVWQAGGVDWVDDLNSTTPQSTVAAVLALGRRCVLICGGDDKQLAWDELVVLVPSAVRAIVLLPGAGSERIARALQAAGSAARVHRVTGLDQAVALAAEAARPGEAVLFSPACPGAFHAFYGSDPGGRGFRAAVRAIVPAATSPPRRRAPG